MTKKRKLFLLLAIAMVGGLFWYLKIYTKTPKYSLNIIAKAIKNSDKATFERYVDIDSLSHNILLEYQPYKEEYSDSIKQLLRKRVRKEIIAAVGSDALTRREESDPTSYTYLIKYLIEHNSCKGISDLRTDDQSAVAVLQFTFPKFPGVLFNLKVRLRILEGHWQVVDVLRLDSFAEDIQRLVISK